MREPVRVEPTISLLACLERVQAHRENAMRRAADFEAAGLVVFTRNATEEARFYDALSQWLQRVPGEWP